MNPIFSCTFILDCKNTVIEQADASSPDVASLLGVGVGMFLLVTAALGLRWLLLKLVARWRGRRG